MVRAVKVVPLAEEGFVGPRSFGHGSAGSGRRTMGKVPSLVFDLDDLNDAGQHAPTEAQEEVSAAEVQQKLQALLEAWSEPEYMLLLHVRFAREDAAKRGQSLTVADLADTLRRLGYAVKIRTALGGGPGGACLRSLRHSFLTVSVSGPSGTLSYVLDPRFRDQFEIAHTTPRYLRVLEVVPQEVVTSQDRLTKVVEALCSEMARAFQETGTPLPPWRQQAAMLSKWMPRRSEEVDLSATLNKGAVQAPGPAGAGANGAARRVTGPNTVAQRLMMLGVMQHQSNPSPIAEGVEGTSGSAGEGGEWEALNVPPSASSGSSVHLDWDESASEGAEEHETGPTAANPTFLPARAPVAVPPPPPARRAASGDHAQPAEARRGAFPGRAIFDGICAAAANLPHRRNNTWAG